MISEADNINRKIRDTESKIAVIKDNIITARVSAFRYFWPFLLLSIFGFVFGYLYIFVYCFSTPLDERTFSTTVGYSTIAVIFMLIHVVGGVIARSKAADINSRLDAEEIAQRYEIKQLEKQLLDLNVDLKAIEIEGAEAAEEAATAELSAEPEVPVAAASEVPSISTEAQTTEAPAYSFGEMNQALLLIDDEINKVESKRMEILKKNDMERRGSFYYFWPFFALSFFAFRGMQFAMSTFRYASHAFGNNAFWNREFMFIAVPASCFVLIHIFGGIFARNKRDKHNNKVVELQTSIHKEEIKFRDQITELEYRKRKILEKYNAIQNVE